MYFKAYGANCYGKRTAEEIPTDGIEKLDRCSFYERERLVNKNILNIEKFDQDDKFEFIRKADSPFLFAALCFELRRFMKFIGNTSQESFISHLPIQFDATCNGYKHLAMLSYIYDIFKALNLTPRTEHEIQRDFYCDNC